MRPRIFFDLETTGTDKANDRIVEIALIRMDEKGFEGRYEFQSYINPTIPIPPGATEVHGITDEMVKDKPTFAQLAKKLHYLFSGCDIYGYNSNSFDIPLFVTELNRCGFTLDLESVLFIDACVIFKRKEERTLTAAMKFYCGKDHEGAHGAMADVLATIDVLNAQEKHYNDMPNTLTELALYCNYDKERCDISGCFVIDADGDHILAFGKHKGLKAKNCKPYLNWMNGQDFMPDTKAIIQKFI